PDERYRRRVRGGREEAFVPGLFLHLPAARAAADEGGAPAHGTAREDQRVVRHREDRGNQGLPGVPQAVRVQRHLRDAHQPLRSRRQLQPRNLPRAAGTDPQVPRGEGRREPGGGRVGIRHAAPRVPLRRRPGGRLRAPDGALRLGRDHQRGHGRGRQHRRARRDRAGGHGLVGRDRLRPVEAGRHAAQAPRREPPARDRLAPRDGPAQRHRADLSLVPGQPGPDPRLVPAAPRQRGPGRRSAPAILALALLGTAAPAEAGTFAPAGDAALRADIQLLADYGLISGPVTTWPLSWAPIAAELEAAAEDELPGRVSAALARVRAAARRETRRGELRAHAAVAGAEKPSRIRSFAATPREAAEVRAGLDWAGERIVLALDAQLVDSPDDGRKVRGDNSLLGV